MSPKIFDMLERLAINNPGTKGRYKLAAGIVYKKHLIATGVNSYKSHPLMTQFGKNDSAIYIHAEVDAIKNALRLIDMDQIGKCDLYVLRVKRSGDKKTSPWTRALSCPCEGCQRAIVHFGLRNVYYTTNVTNNYTHIADVQHNKIFNPWQNMLTSETNTAIKNHTEFEKVLAFTK